VIPGRMLVGTTRLLTFATRTLQITMAMPVPHRKRRALWDSSTSNQGTTVLMDKAVMTLAEPLLVTKQQMLAADKTALTRGQKAGLDYAHVVPLDRQ